MVQPIKFQSNRRFGVEIELRSFDLRDFKSHRLNRDNRELPLGINEIANYIARSLKEKVIIKSFHSTHNNNSWVLKTDSSCGIEICSMPAIGNYGIDKICDAIEGISKDKRIVADDKCSFHITVDMSELSEMEVSNILSWWIKCESVFLDTMPSSRKTSQFCQVVGMSDLFDIEKSHDYHEVIRKLGSYKYYTINCKNYLSREKNTIEFRIGDHSFCKNAYEARNWMRLILHFIERTYYKNIYSYNKNNCWTSLVWLEPKHVFELLGFFETLTPELIETRTWFLNRLKKFVFDFKGYGIWSKEGRIKSMESIKEIENILNITNVEKTT